MKEHISEISNNDSTNAFTKHLMIHHPEHVGDTNAFKFKSEKVFKKCLERQISEGVAIHSSDADILLNSKSELV